MSQRVTDRVLEEIRARTDIVGLVNARVPLRRVGSTFKACCPFHKEKTPSFHVNPARQTYHCFGCGAHGDVFKFLMTQDGLVFMDAVRLLAERAGVALAIETDYAAEERNTLLAIHAEAAAFYRRCLLQIPEAAAARDYLTSRKLTPEISERFGIGYAPLAPDTLLRWGEKYNFKAEMLVAAGLLAPPNNPDRPDAYYDRFHGRLMFPICDVQGRVVAFSARVLDPKSHPAKYVNSPETPIFVKSRVLYALDKARSSIVKSPRREALVCEGQIDVIRCHSAGFDTAVASQGTAFTKEHVELLRKYADSVLLVFDGDSAGRKAALRTGSLFLEAGLPVRVAALPTGDDPDSLLRDKGPDVFRDVLDSAVSLTAFQIHVLSGDERDPHAVDAINRVSQAVFETLANCPQAVLRSHLLQEAATLLHLPASAMEEDLEALRQKIAARPAPPAPRSNRETIEPSDGQTVRPSHHPTVQPSDRPTVQPSDPSAASAIVASEVELRFCELLLHHGEEREVAALVDMYVPPDLLRHADTRAIYEAWRQTHRGTPEALSQLSTNGHDAVRRMLARLARSDPRMAHAREATMREAIDGLIARIWLSWIEAERGLTKGERRRLELTMLLKALKKPKDSQELYDVLTVELARRGQQSTQTTAPAPVAPEPVAPPPPVHASAAPPLPEADGWQEEDPF
ncbi:MAG: DNA primase [Kiritimatiellia bacterium]